VRVGEKTVTIVVTEKLETPKVTYETPKVTYETPKVTHERLVALCRSGDLKQLQTHFRNGDLMSGLVRKDDDAAFRSACSYGQLEVARWLYEFYYLSPTNGIPWRRCFIEALHSACANGYVPVAKWLFETMSLTPDEICAKGNSSIMLTACMTGYLQVARWIYEVAPNGPFPPNGDLLQVACGGNGGVELVAWLVETFEMTAADVHAENDEARRLASVYGHSAIIKWLDEKFPVTAVQTTSTPAVVRASEIVVAPGKPLIESYPTECRMVKVPHVWPYPLAGTPDKQVTDVLFAGEEPNYVVFEGKTFCLFKCNYPLDAIRAHLAGKPEYMTLRLIDMPLTISKPFSDEMREMYDVLDLSYVEWLPDGPNSERRAYALANRFSQACAAWKTNEHLKPVETPFAANFRESYPLKALPRAVKLLAPYFGIRYVERDGQFVAEVEKAQ
jgi:hypothetical protein